MITTVVFIIGNLLFPDAFRLSDDNNTAVMATETAISDPAPISRPNYNDPAPGTSPVIEPVNTATPVPAAAAAYQTNLSETDPKALFGDPKAIDNFERGSSSFGLNAGLNDDDAIRIIALNNRLSLEPKKNNGWISWRLRPPAFKNGAASMEFSITTCARGDRTGLIMHAPDYGSGHGYYFSLACEGSVSILKDSEILGTTDAQDLFKNKSGDTNTMTAVIRGNTLTALLNGEAVLSVQDSTYTEGYSGFFTAPQNQDTLTMDILTFNSYYNQ